MTREDRSQVIEAAIAELASREAYWAARQGDLDEAHRLAELALAIESRVSDSAQIAAAGWLFYGEKL